MALDLVLEGLIDSVDWQHVRSIRGADSSYVRSAVSALFEATTGEEAESAYWRVDNYVVVQGQLFEAACHVVGPCVVALGTDLSPMARKFVMELLVEIALGVPHHEEVEAGHGEVDGQCKAELRRGLWSFYSALSEPHEDLRLSALDILDAVEQDRPRLTRITSRLATEDPAATVRNRAAEVV